MFATDKHIIYSEDIQKSKNITINKCETEYE